MRPIAFFLFIFPVYFSGVPGAHGHSEGGDSNVLLRYEAGAFWSDRGGAVEVAEGPPGIEAAASGEDVEVVEQAVADLLAGPTGEERARGFQSFFPSGTELEGIERGSNGTKILLKLPRAFPAFDEEHLLEDLIHLLGQWTQKWPEDAPYRFAGRLAGEDEHRLLDDFLPEHEPVSKPEVDDAALLQPMGGDELETMSQPHPPVQGQGQPVGALSDASVFLSPGHGWFYSSNLGRWATQRGNMHEYIEDHGTGEAVLQFLHQYLWNAGARTYTARERCLNTNMVIIQNGGTGYSETGSWQTESLGGTYDGSHRAATTVTGSPSATATFTPDIPEAGYYGVYVWYRRADTGTTTQDARFEVNHTGDTTTWVQDQNRDGFTWKYIGSYYFAEGENPETGSVTISNESTISGRRVVADAVRFGGGMGDVPDPVPGTVSGKPRWEESGRYYAGFAGMPNWESNNQVGAMPRWAAWEHEPWEDGKSVYLSWHTNASGGTGTETYAYSSGGWGGTFNGVPGSDVLRNNVHSQVVRDIRAEWDSGWADRGTRTANLGELNPRNNDQMPAALLEVGFHDHAGDTRYLLDPEFRRTVARAVYQGILRYYYLEVDGFDNLTYLPEPPRRFQAIDEGDGTVTLEWRPGPVSTGPNALYGHQPTGYRVYRSYDGYGFDNGRDLDGGTNVTYTFDDLEPGETVYFRVTATNDGGESFPTATLAVRPSVSAEADRILLVHGFDRMDRFMNVVEDDPHSANAVQRGYLWRMNTFNYAIEHAEAIAAFGEDLSIQSTDAQALEFGLVSLDGYSAVVWMAGQQAHVNDIGNQQFRAFSAGTRNRLETYLNDGGRLFVSGSEIAYDQTQAGASAWLNDVLKVDLDQRSSGSNSFRGASASIMADIPSTSFGHNEAGFSYHVEYADVVEPVEPAAPLLTFLSDPPSTQVVHGFESLSGWQDPNYAGQTNADSASTFEIVTAPVVEGSGAGELNYVWGSGNLIRLHNSSMPAFSADSDFSIWVHGDNSGHRVAIVFRDSDNELWVNDDLVLDFEGWHQIVWKNVRENPGSIWLVSPEDGEITGPDVRLDSIRISRDSDGPSSGSIYFDHAVSTPLPVDEEDLEMTAGVQYDGDYQLVYMTVPFESIGTEAARTAIMGEALSFFGMGPSLYDRWMETVFTEDQIADPEVSGPYADPTGSGVPNLLMFAFGLDPWEARREGLPLVWREDGKLRFGFQQSLEAMEVLDFVVEVSEDLVNWRDGSEETEVVEVIEEDGLRWVEVEDTVPSEDGRRFIRLKVEGL